jgi:DNA-binding winged helix-turn-helix (wHTH) protein
MYPGSARRGCRKPSEMHQIILSLASMTDKPFLLNNRFLINPALGTVKDTQTAQETRLEPRLMSLLCLLAASRNELVSRDLITKEVWDDYGNADEGLTQAISYLRKTLCDTRKELIETVPKKGYVLHGDISTPASSIPVASGPATNVVAKGWSTYKKIGMGAFCFILLLAGYFILGSIQRRDVKNSDTIESNQKSADTASKVGSRGADLAPDSLRKPPASPH